MLEFKHYRNPPLKAFTQSAIFIWLDQKSKIFQDRLNNQINRFSFCLCLNDSLPEAIESFRSKRSIGIGYFGVLKLNNSSDSFRSNHFSEWSIFCFVMWSCKSLQSIYDENPWTKKLKLRVMIDWQTSNSWNVSNRINPRRFLW